MNFSSNSGRSSDPLRPEHRQVGTDADDCQSEHGNDDPTWRHDVDHITGAGVDGMVMTLKRTAIAAVSAAAILLAGSQSAIADTQLETKWTAWKKCGGAQVRMQWYRWYVTSKNSYYFKPYSMEWRNAKSWTTGYISFTDSYHRKLGEGGLYPFVVGRKGYSLAQGPAYKYVAREAGPAAWLSLYKQNEGPDRAYCTATQVYIF